MNRLAWIDAFIEEMRPYLFVREEDDLLIVVPNRSYRLNATGVTLTSRLLKGARIGELLPGIEKDPTRESQVLSFFRALRSFVAETFSEDCLGEGIEVEPFARPHNLLPVLSEVALTYRCNLDCVFCYAGCSCQKRDASREMSVGEVGLVLEKIRHDARVPSVSLTGGEPAMRSDLPALVARAAELGLRVNLISNGTMIMPALARRLVDAGLSSAQISLEGPTASIHEAMTRVPGSFAKTLRGLDALRDAGVTVHTHSTLTTLNAPSVEEHVSFLASLGLERFSMNQLIPTGTVRYRRELWIRYSEIGTIVERARKTARTKAIEFMWYSPTPLCLYNPIAAGLGNKSCAACDGLLSVAPDGRVLPCSSVEDDVGDLLSEPFSDIWQGERARWWNEKRYAHPVCRSCEDFAACAGACPLYWRAVGFDELEGGGRAA